MTVTKHILSAGSNIVALNLFRNIQTTQVVLFRASENKSRRMGRQSRSELFPNERLTKDFVDADLREEYSNIPEEFLEQTYEEQVSELKNSRRRIHKIMMKKSFAKYPKEPNMLTFNERQHIMYLHKSDPVEWTAEHLSESFPALPWVIRKILKQKWVPDNEEKMKLMDQTVLDNWEKFKRNELEASPKLLEHLKKFVDKRDNLELQLKNPKFFHLPVMEKKLVWKSGALNSMLVKYEKEVERLIKDRVGVKSLPEKTEENENTLVMVSDIEKKIEAIKGTENVEENFLLEKDVDTVFKKRREKQVTLENLKKNIFEKTEKKREPISPWEELILQKTLNKTSRSESNSIPESKRLEYKEAESKHPEPSSKLSGDVTGKISGEENREPGRGRRRRLPKEEENVEDDEYKVYPNTVQITNLGSVLFKTEDEIVESDEKGAKMSERTKKPVNYYNTSKDKEVYENHEKILSETVFWKSEKRTKSLDVGMLGIGTNTSPHIAGHLRTYYTYDYPEKIEIPEGKREKGKLYRVKDCYYDDTGKFLYRVPGMTGQ